MTNLYSSAVFIGWGCVVLGLVLEAIYRHRHGQRRWPACSASLDADHRPLPGRQRRHAGDDAGRARHQLLAGHARHLRHLGYTATFVAGFLGHRATSSRGVFTPALRRATLCTTLAQMIYGVVCFATLFSFVGTVLGGIWADQSWGRFWGWDPKENGALLIVIWNALILHARWGGLVKQRGMAVLAVARQHRHRLVLVRHQPARRRPARLRLQQHAGDGAGHLLGQPARVHRGGADADQTLGKLRGGTAAAAGAGTAAHARDARQEEARRTGGIDGDQGTTLTDSSEPRTQRVFERSKRWAAAYSARRLAACAALFSNEETRVLTALIDWSLNNRFIVLAGAVASSCSDCSRWSSLDIDAFPDTTPVQVQINTVAPALGPEEVEQQITFPIEQALGGLPGLRAAALDLEVRPVAGRRHVRGRHRHLLRPPAHQRAAGDGRAARRASTGPKMGPVATGLGEVFHYVVTGDSGDDADRAAHASTTGSSGPQLRTVPGTAEINTWGGYEKQYQVRIDPTGSSSTA